MNDPGSLVTPAWLSGQLKHPGVAVVDVRWSPRGSHAVAKREYEDGHIPGAAFMDVDRDLAGKPFVDGPGRHPLPDADVFAAKMASLGIDDEMIVIAYDDVQGSVAARLWWLLWVTGHKAALLDGGLQAWRAQGGAVESGPMAPRERVMFASVPWPPDRIVTAGAVESTVRAGSAPVLDARIVERYRGETEPYDPVAGHVPGARSASYLENLQEDGSFRSREELRERYAALGVTGDAAICYCGSGVTACHDLFAIHLAGFGDARLYEGSWSDWVHDGTRAAATGPDQG
jgi:thiosulfate/3-mercaptopyruvate sulfurtransferase